MHIATMKIVLASVLSTSVGLAAGAYATKRHLDAQYDEQMTEELAAIRLYYENKSKYKTPQEATKALIPQTDELPETVLEDKAVDFLVKEAATAQALYQGQTVNITQGAPTTVEDVADEEEIAVIEDFAEPMNETHSVFVNGEPLDPDVYDLAEEMLARKNGVPYVIAQSELDADEFDHEHIILTWFTAGEATLVDEDEKPIDDLENTVGRDNLNKFGRGSGDANVVYIRNEARGVDYEVIQDARSYMETVLGLTDDYEVIQHSAMPKRRQHLGD